MQIRFIMAASEAAAAELREASLWDQSKEPPCIGGSAKPSG